VTPRLAGRVHAWPVWGMPDTSSPAMKRNDLAQTQSSRRIRAAAAAAEDREATNANALITEQYRE